MQTSQRQPDARHHEAHDEGVAELAGDFESPEQVAASAVRMEAQPVLATGRDARRVNGTGNGNGPADPDANPAAFDDWLAGQIQELLDAPAAAPAKGNGDPPAQAPANANESSNADIDTAAGWHDELGVSAPAPAGLPLPDADEPADTRAQAQAFAAPLGELAGTMTGAKAQTSAGPARGQAVDSMSGGEPCSTVREVLATDSTPPVPGPDATVEAELLSFEQLIEQESEAMAREQSPEGEAGAGEAAAVAVISRQEAASSAAEAVANTEAAAEPSGEIRQLDEFLAGQADDAVAGDFETVHDVMSAQQAVAGVRMSGAAEQSAAPGGDRAQGESRGGLLKQPVSDGRASALAADPVGLEETRASAAEGPSPAVPPPASHRLPAAGSGAAAAGERQAGRRPLASRLAAMVLRSAGRVAGGARAVTCYACAVLNRPLNRLSESQRNLFGYAGVISLINGLLLLLARAFNLLG